MNKKYWIIGGVIAAGGVWWLMSRPSEEAGIEGEDVSPQSYFLPSAVPQSSGGYSMGAGDTVAGGGSAAPDTGLAALVAGLGSALNRPQESTVNLEKIADIQGGWMTKQIKESNIGLLNLDFYKRLANKTQGMREESLGVVYDDEGRIISGTFKNLGAGAIKQHGLAENILKLDTAKTEDILANKYGVGPIVMAGKLTPKQKRQQAKQHQQDVKIATKAEFYSRTGKKAPKGGWNPAVVQAKAKKFGVK